MILRRVAVAPVAFTLVVSVCSPAAQANDPPITPEITAMLRETARDWLLRGIAAERDGRPLEAEGFFRRALDADPGLLAAHLGYARTLDARGHRWEAQEALSRIPRSAWSLDDASTLAYAQTLQSLGAVDDSLAALRERHDSPTTTRALAEGAARAGRFPEALAAARRLVELANDETERHAARVLVRALVRLVAEADAVRAPFAVTGFRRALMAD